MEISSKTTNLKTLDYKLHQEMWNLFRLSDANQKQIWTKSSHEKSLGPQRFREGNFQFAVSQKMDHHKNAPM